MQDNKKREAAVRGAKKLLELDTPREEIASTLIELGIREEETAGVIDEAAKLIWKAEGLQQHGQEKINGGNAKAENPGPPEGGREGLGAFGPINTNSKINRFFPGKKNPPQHPKPQKEPPFWKKILPVGKSYIPKLRTGGRNRVREIIADSPLDAH